MEQVGLLVERLSNDNSASARSYNKYIIALFRLGSTGEYLILGFCIGPPYSQANTANIPPNILLYCPPTRAIFTGHPWTYALSSRKLACGWR